MRRNFFRLQKVEARLRADGRGKDWPTIRRRWEQLKRRIVKDLEAWESIHPVTPAEPDQRHLEVRSLAERWARSVGMSSRALQAEMAGRVEGRSDA